MPHHAVGEVRGGRQELQGGELLVQGPLGIRAGLALEADLEVARAVGVEAGSQKTEEVANIVAMAVAG